MKVYINWSTDENHANDTVTQATVFLPGVQKKIVFEAHTSTTCGPCATYNPALDAFVQSHFDSIVPIKIHCWWPAIGDPMYALNIPQARVRILYNSISAIPGLMVDGVLQQISGYSQATLQPLYDSRRALASPIGLTVTDTRLAGDTIKATIVINVVSALPSNVDYRLRINAIERKISYTTPPGSNGETTFYDVFRKQFPSINGITVNYTPGTYTIEYKYKRESAWVDSMMYTSVFIQDEYTHEIINGAKARNYYVYDKIEQPAVTDNSIEPKFSSLETNPLLVGNGIEMENMEGTIPPPGWSIINTDSNFTFWQYVYAAVGGPSFPGVKAIRMSYYSYVENVGTKDYLKSKVYNNVNAGDSIKFDYAYAQRTPYEDRLVVKVSLDGGNTFPYTIFDKQGANLGTTAPSSSSFVPTTGQWGTFAGRFGTLVGVEPIGNLTPEKFELVQNYPNPFNPSTTIKYNIAKSSYVTLKVYNILGSEVASLVNRNLKAGEYQLQFNAGNLSSGVYFYKIIAGSFTDIKKMLLVK
jgi:thiol-disulfide isomerase/thioredoxin